MEVSRRLYTDIYRHSLLLTPSSTLQETLLPRLISDTLLTSERQHFTMNFHDMPSPVAMAKPKILLTGLDVRDDIPEYFRALYGSPKEIKVKIDEDTRKIAYATLLLLPLSPSDRSYTSQNRPTSSSYPHQIDLIYRSSGFAPTTYFFTGTAPAMGLTWLTDTLRKGNYAGVMIGSGLRLIPEQTELFERVVGVVVKEGKGCRVMFKCVG